MRYACILLFLLACGRPSQAKPPDQIMVRLVNITGHPESISYADMLQIGDKLYHQWNEQLYYQLRISYGEIPLAELGSTAEHIDDSKYQYARLSACRTWLQEHEGIEPWTIYYCIFPRLLCWNGRPCLGGTAAEICRLNGSIAFAMGNARTTDWLGRSAINKSTLIVLHELGHLTGMWHKNAPDFEPNIMDYNAGGYLTDDPELQLPFLNESVIEYQQCIGSTKKQRIKDCKLRPEPRRTRCIQRAKRWATRRTLIEEFGPTL